MKLEKALQYNEESEVIHTWITRLLSGYFSTLKEESMDIYIQQAYFIFITLHDVPLDASTVERCIQNLQVYCLSRKHLYIDVILAILKNTIITVNSMFTLVSLLRINIEHDTHSIRPIVSLLMDILDGSELKDLGVKRRSTND